MVKHAGTRNHRKLPLAVGLKGPEWCVWGWGRAQSELVLWKRSEEQSLPEQ